MVIRLYMVSHPVENAEVLARQLVEKKLAACVHLLPKGTSIYQWDGRICEEEELLLLIKTAADANKLKSAILNEHPHDCPEIISIEVTDGHRDYLEWVIQSTKETP